eukprot:3767446-Amphidinium_carterae.1
MKDVITEGSKPGYVRHILIQAGMERGIAVGTAGVKLEIASEDGEYIGDENHKIYRSVCGRLQFASPRRPDLLFTLKELGRGLAKPRKSHWQLMKHLMRYLRGGSETVLVHVPKTATKGVFRAQVDSDQAGCQNMRRSTSCGVIWWVSVLITSYSRTQSTIATSSAESEYYGACACASEAVYVKELLKFTGEETHTQLELDASSAISMGNKTTKLVRARLGRSQRQAYRGLRSGEFQPDLTRSGYLIPCAAAADSNLHEAEVGPCAEDVEQVRSSFDKEDDPFSSSSSNSADLCAGSEPGSPGFNIAVVADYLASVSTVLSHKSSGRVHREVSGRAVCGCPCDSMTWVAAADLDTPASVFCMRCFADAFSSSKV